MKAIKTTAVAFLVLGVAFISGCDRHSTKEVFYLVASNMQVPYWQTSMSPLTRSILAAAIAMATASGFWSSGAMSA